MARRTSRTEKTTAVKMERTWLTRSDAVSPSWTETQYTNNTYRTARSELSPMYVACTRVARYAFQSTIRVVLRISDPMYAASSEKTPNSTFTAA